MSPAFSLVSSLSKIRFQPLIIRYICPDKFILRAFSGRFALPEYQTDQRIQSNATSPKRLIHFF